MVCLGAWVGAALLHPPKSSSPLIFGEVTFGCAVVLEDHPPKSFEGARACVVGAVVVDGLVTLPHASFDPHASVLDRPDE